MTDYYFLSCEPFIDDVCGDHSSISRSHDVYIESVAMKIVDICCYRDHRGSSRSHDVCCYGDSGYIQILLWRP